MAPASIKSNSEQEKKLTRFIEQLLASNPFAADAPEHFHQLQQRYPLTPEQHKLWLKKVDQYRVRAHYYQRKGDDGPAYQEWLSALKLNPLDPQLQQDTAEALWQSVQHQGLRTEQDERRRRAVQLNRQVLLVAEGELLSRAQHLAQQLSRRPKRYPRRLRLFGLAAAGLLVLGLLFPLLSRSPSVTPHRSARPSTPADGDIPLDWIPSDERSQFFVHRSQRIDHDYGALYSLKGRIQWQGPPVSRLRVHLNLYDGQDTLKQDFDPLDAHHAPLYSGDSVPVEYSVRLGSRPLQRASLQPGKVQLFDGQEDKEQVPLTDDPVRLSLRGVRTLQTEVRTVYYYDFQLANRGTDAVAGLRLRLVWPGTPGYQLSYTLLDPQRVPLAPGAAYNYRLVVQPPVELATVLGSFPQAELME